MTKRFLFRRGLPTMGGGGTGGTGGSSVGSLLPQKKVWNPTIYAMSVEGPPAGQYSQYKTEIDCYAASLAANPGLSAIVGGYTFYIGWNILEPTTAGAYNFSVVDQVYTYLQLRVPGARMLVQTTCYSNWLNSFSATAGQGILPSYVYTGSTGVYGPPSVGGSGAGWALIGYNNPAAGDYQFVVAELSNVNVSGRYQACQAALLQHLLASCPNADGVIDYTPSEISNYTGSPTTPPQFSAVNFNTNWIARGLGLAQSAPTLIYGQMMEYTGTGMAESDLQNLVYTSAANGVAVSCTDVYWTGTAIDLTDAQRFFTGYVKSGSTWVTGGKDCRGLTSSFPTMQPFDLGKYAAGASSQANTAAQITNDVVNTCYVALKADHLAVAMASEFATSTNTAFSLNDWYDVTKSGTAGNGFIVTGLIAAGPIPNTTIPTAFLDPPTNLAATPGKGSFTLIWNATAEPGTVTYSVFVDGTQVASGITVLGAVVTGVASGSHSVTVAKVNANGTGAQSQALTVVIS